MKKTHAQTEKEVPPMILKRLGIIILAGVMLLSAAVICSGADSTPPSGPPPDGKAGPPPPPDAARLKEDLQKSLDKLMTEKIINFKKKTIILEYYDPFFAKVSGSDPRINPAGERIQRHEDVRRASGFIKKASPQPQELIYT
jgi:hypothetical protein